jgi:hypothetical protein
VSLKRNWLKRLDKWFRRIEIDPKRVSTPRCLEWAIDVEPFVNGVEHKCEK